MNPDTITAERLRELLDYDPDTGQLVWLVKRGGTAVAGSVAGGIRLDGYINIYVDGRPYLAHRLAWLHIHGVWPTADIDHVNGDRADNRAVNLREATNATNLHNVVAPQSNNTSGFRGVSWHKGKGSWRAQIRVDGCRLHLGYYPTPEAASAAYMQAKAEHHGGEEWYAGRRAR